MVLSIFLFAVILNLMIISIYFIFYTLFNISPPQINSRKHHHVFIRHHCVRRGYVDCIFCLSWISFVIPVFPPQFFFEDEIIGKHVDGQKVYNQVHKFITK